MWSLSFNRSKYDHTFFFKHNKEQITTLIVYINDMSLTRNDHEERKALQEHLAREFEMKYLGELKYFLKLKCQDKKKCIFMSQQKYILELLKKTRNLNQKYFLELKCQDQKRIYVC
jgi:hypothetical protein